MDSAVFYFPLMTWKFCLWPISADRAGSAPVWRQEALRAEGAITSRMCQRESGRVSTADIDGCATRMRFNMNGNLGASPNGNGATFFHVTGSGSSSCGGVSRSAFAFSDGTLVSSSLHDGNKACLQPRQHLTDQIICSAFGLWSRSSNNTKRFRPAAACSISTDWASADTMTQYLLLSECRRKKTHSVAWWWHYCPVLP